MFSSYLHNDLHFLLFFLHIAHIISVLVVSVKNKKGRKKYGHYIKKKILRNVSP